MSKDQQRRVPLMTVSDVAERLSISRSLVYQLVESGTLPVCRIGNGRGTIRFRSQDIEEYIESCLTVKTDSSDRRQQPRLKHIHL